MVTPTLPPRMMRYRRMLIGFGGFAGLIALLSGLITFWLPGYVKTQLEVRLSDLLQRHVSVASIEIKL